MRRTAVAKFPNSVQLFKFCQKVLMDQKGGKVHDQEVGAILNFNPSDCSHWKRGEKNVKSVFALAKLSEALSVEVSLIHDVASGAARLEEAYFEYTEGRVFKDVLGKAQQADSETIEQCRQVVEHFAQDLLRKAEFTTPPLYLPEILRFFPFVTTQTTEILDKLSRILKIRQGQYLIQYKKGELKPQTRMSMVKDLARITFQGERARFEALGQYRAELVGFEETLFTASLLAPKALILEELAKMDNRRNVIAELATLFWVPKTLIGFQLQDIVRCSKEPVAMGTQQNQPQFPQERRERSHGEYPSV